MKVITFEDIRNLDISSSQCYEWVSEMIRDKNKTHLPPKISMHPQDGVFCNVMPCIISDQWGGVKIVNRYPLRRPSLDSKLLLLDMITGEFLALMDANWITAMRTGAVAAHSIKLFAKKNFKTVSILGLGNTARATLLILLDIFPDKVFDIKLKKYKGQEILFADRFKEYKNVNFRYIDTDEELIKGSDVVISCVTYFANDLCPDEYFDEGVLVVPVHTRGFTNCDLFFDKVYADDTGHVCHFGNFDKFRNFAEVCDVVNGNAKGRENDKERILAYNIGLSIHDINFAAHIYSYIKNNTSLYEKLANIDMCGPTEKFWI